MLDYWSFLKDCFDKNWIILETNTKEKRHAVPTETDVLQFIVRREMQLHNSDDSVNIFRSNESNFDNAYVPHNVNDEGPLWEQT